MQERKMWWVGEYKNKGTLKKRRKEKKRHKVKA
jgi:hypothetical protein